MEMKKNQPRQLSTNFWMMYDDEGPVGCIERRSAGVYLAFTVAGNELPAFATLEAAAAALVNFPR